ncbi:monovalent cation/H+ antiporter complex subunit F [Streptomyces sp. NPDC059740]|uniref:monovalent cation/H+ antiporter complex subunit F n=1 Tax=Streptomyces sp. NPDC059740 TaxID=3346926 RepID=UPI00365E1FD6
MNGWLWAALVLVVCGVPPCVWVACRGPATRRLAGTALLTTQVTAVLLLVAQGLARTSYADLALVLAVLGPMGTLVFVRFVGAEEPASEQEDPERGGTATSH